MHDFWVDGLRCKPFFTAPLSLHCTASCLDSCFLTMGTVFLQSGPPEEHFGRSCLRAPRYPWQVHLDATILGNATLTL